MILRVKNFYLIISPYIVVSLAIILIKSNWINSVLCFSALLIHEMGHIIVGYILGERLSILKMLPFGFSCNFKNQSKIEKNKMLKILIAGPAVNFITAGLILYWTPNYAMINCLIGLFNLLPIGELDGIRIINIIISN